MFYGEADKVARDTWPHCERMLEIDEALPRGWIQLRSDPPRVGMSTETLEDVLKRDRDQDTA